MKMLTNLRLPVAGAALVTLTLVACEPPPVDTVQRGYRGVGMERWSIRTRAQRA